MNKTAILLSIVYYRILLLKFIAVWWPWTTLNDIQFKFKSWHAEQRILWSRNIYALFYVYKNKCQVPKIYLLAMIVWTNRKRFPFFFFYYYFHRALFVIAVCILRKRFRWGRLFTLAGNFCIAKAFIERINKIQSDSVIFSIIMI